MQYQFSIIVGAVEVFNRYASLEACNKAAAIIRPELFHYLKVTVTQCVVVVTG